MLYPGHSKFRYISFFLSFILLSQFLYAQNYASKRKELETKRKELQIQIQKSKRELQQVKTLESNSLKQLQAIGNQINTREKIIESVSQETFEISIEIANQEKVIESLKSDLVNLKKDYGNYIAAAYKKREVNAHLFFVFDAKNLNQAFKRLKYLSTYGSYRERQARLILNTQKEMVNALRQMIQIKQEKLGLIQIKEIEKKELVADKKEEGMLLSKFQTQVKGLKQKIAEQEKAARKLNKSIDNLIAAEIEAARKAEERKRAEAERKSNKPAAPKTANSYLSDLDLKLSGDFADNKGKFPWPVNGSISQYFGEHPHPTLKGVNTNNNGIDIVTSAQAQVKPVYKGTVKAIFPIPGLDRVVLINHGEYYTVYARLATVNVKIGQVVDRNDVLGEVATNSEDGSSSMHFEVWKQRVFLNPQPWLRAK